MDLSGSLSNDTFPSVLNLTFWIREALGKQHDQVWRSWSPGPGHLLDSSVGPVQYWLADLGRVAYFLWPSVLSLEKKCNLPVWLDVSENYIGYTKMLEKEWNVLSTTTSLMSAAVQAFCQAQEYKHEQGIILALGNSWSSGEDRFNNDYILCGSHPDVGAMDATGAEEKHPPRVCREQVSRPSWRRWYLGSDNFNNVPRLPLSSLAPLSSRFILSEDSAEPFVDISSCVQSRSRLLSSFYIW